MVWLSGFGYKKTLTVNNNSGGVLTNYQIPITINRSAGSDSGNVVYVGTKCLETYADIRFCNADGITLLDYWIESSDANTAKVWIECDTLATGDNTLTFYYGKAGATSLSNGKATFPQFDDFNGVGVDSSLWSTNAGTTVSGSQAHLIRAAADISLYSSPTLFPTNYSVRYRAKSKHFQNTTYTEYVGFYGITAGYAIFYAASTGSTTGMKLRTYDGSASTYTLVTDWTADTWGILEFIRDASASIKLVINDLTTITHTTNLFTGDGYVRMVVASAADAQVDIDWVLVRKYTATEPTVTSWGTEAAVTIGRYKIKTDKDKGTANPLIDGTAAPGTSGNWTPIDHVHPTDTGRAAASHTHAESDVTNLTGDLAAKIAGSTGAVDNVLLRADGTGGNTAQNSTITVDDLGNLVTIGSLTIGTIAIASDVLLKSDDTERANSGAGWAKLTQITVPTGIVSSTFRVKFDYKDYFEGAGGSTSYFRIKINGVSVGVEVVSTSGYLTSSQDLSTIKGGDTIELWAYCDYFWMSGAAYAKNFRIYGTVSAALISTPPTW
jgi:hypothetical protein